MSDKYTSQIRLTRAVRDLSVVPTQKYPDPPILVPVAGFTFTPASGEFPLSVTFTDTSLNKPLVYQWDFTNDGTVDSFEKNPTFVFQNAGTFSPRLFVSNHAGSNSHTAINGIAVSVPPAVVASFTADFTTGTAPFVVQFTDTSTNTPLDWAWNFGDGNTSVEQNPQHTYALPGVYNVSLTAANSTSSDTHVETGFIHAVNVLASPNFTWTPSNGILPLTVQFTDTSTDPTIGGSAVRGWDFTNDGIIDSNLLNPSHTYTQEGAFTVSLTLTNDGGPATSTKVGIINVAPLPAAVSFTATPLSGVFPLSVTFTDTSTGTVTSRLWEFGDGNTSTQASPTHVYAAAGFYTVSLTDTNAGGSNTATVTNMIQATNSPPTAVFTQSATSGAIPLTVNFSNSSAGIGNTYQWDFNGDGVTDSTATNPSATYTTPGVYTVRLTAINDGGANVQTKTNLITVTNVVPVANFAASPVSGAFPLLVNFTDTSTGVVASRLWNFGDGVTSTLLNPSHTYAALGTYTVTLTATNDGGSNTKTQTNLITATNQPPVANFTYTPASGQIPFTVTFTNTSTGANQSWLWNFGDGATSTLQNPTHSYTTVGNYTVSLVTTNDGGNNTKTVNNAVLASLALPVANFTISPTTGTVPQTPTITNTTTGTVDSWAWNFGDGATSTLQNPTHTYTVAGTYTVTLTATNAAGSHTKTLTNVVTYIALDYNYMDPANKSASMVLSGGNLTLSCATDGIVVGKYGYNINNAADLKEIYWEMIINARGSGIWFGLVRAGHPLTAGSYPGQRATDYSFSSNGMANNGGVATVATFFDPDWLTQGIDGVGLKIQRNGGYSATQRHGVGSSSGIGAAWFGGGAIPAGIYYPCVRLTGGANVTMNFGPTMGIRSYGVWTAGLE